MKLNALGVKELSMNGARLIAKVTYEYLTDLYAHAFWIHHLQCAVHANFAHQANSWALDDFRP